MESLQNIMDDTNKWSKATFGAGYNYSRVSPLIHHLQKETEEVLEAFGLFMIEQNLETKISMRKRVVSELSDCMLLLIDAVTEMDCDQDELFRAMRHKLEVNKKRTWKAPDVNGVIEHIEEI
jgi:hypothetical protein